MAALMLALAVAPAFAQREPHIGYVYPAGGRQGATFQAEVGGQYLDGTTNVHVLGAGVSFVIERHYKTLTPQQLNGIKNNIEKMQQLEEAGKSDPAKLKEAARVRKQIETVLMSAGIDQLDRRLIDQYRKKINNPKKQLNPALSEQVVVKVTIAPDATPGNREIRLKTATGLSNPMVFSVGRWTERVEKEANDRKPEAVPVADLPVVLNGQIMPGDVDRFQFAARKGEHIVAAVAARTLIPYLADAVPGWFQATLAIRDTNDHELAYVDDFRFHPDPALTIEIPADGEYVVEIKDSIFRGREDFVYRLALGRFPFVTGIFPLGGRAGEKATVSLEGWNLPRNTGTFDLSAHEPGILPNLIASLDGAAKPVPFAVDDLPEVDEKEGNNDPAGAGPLKLPVIVNGRIQAQGDQDFFRFEGRAGEEIVAEVMARRLSSTLDSHLALFDGAGNIVAVNDDFDDLGQGLETHHADSRLQATLPADGAYCLRIADNQQRGGRGFAYRLRVSAPRPDFALRVVPSALNARTGETVPVTVHALRRDGFSGDIAVVLRDPPPGFALGGGWIPAGQDKARLTLTAPQTGTAAPAALVLEGKATIAGREVVHRAVPAEDMMQAFFYRHLVSSTGDWLASVTDRGKRAVPRLAEKEAVKLAPGGTASVSYTIYGMRDAKFELSLNDPPEGISIKSVKPGDDGVVITLEADGAKVKPGLKGNLIVEAFVERAAKTKDGKGKTGKTRNSIGVLPAIPFEIADRGT